MTAEQAFALAGAATGWGEQVVVKVSCRSCLFDKRFVVILNGCGDECEARGIGATFEEAIVDAVRTRANILTEFADNLAGRAKRTRAALAAVVGE